MNRLQLSSKTRARRTFALQAVLFLASVAPAACTTTMYNGPRRPEEDIAVISSRDTRINYVDGKWVRDIWAGSNAKYELLPGLHAIGISLELRTFKVIYTEIQYSKTITHCFDAHAGAQYQTIPVIRGKKWAPLIIDNVTGESVGVSCRVRRQGADMQQPAPTSVEREALDPFE